MYGPPDISGIVYFAIFGLACAVLLTLGLVGGLVWFFLTHVQVV